MTLKEVEALPKEYLTVTDVGKVLRADPQELRLQARFRPDLLGFPVIVYKSRVKIPKEAFLKFCRGELKT